MAKSSRSEPLEERAASHASIVEIFAPEKMFSRALANLCTLAAKDSGSVRPCASLVRMHASFTPCGVIHPREETDMADMEALTPRQREIYTFIRSKIQGRGY